MAFHTHTSYTIKKRRWKETDKGNELLSSFEDVNWPRGNESPGVLALERDLRRELGRLGLGLIADRTSFTDSHYRGGYAIVTKSGFVAGRNFDLSLMDVVEWVERAGRRKRRNRA